MTIETGLDGAPFKCQPSKFPHPRWYLWISHNTAVSITTDCYTWLLWWLVLDQLCNWSCFGMDCNWKGYQFDLLVPALPISLESKCIVFFYNIDNRGTMSCHLILWDLPIFWGLLIFWDLLVKMPALLSLRSPIPFDYKSTLSLSRGQRIQSVASNISWERKWRTY